MYNDELKGLLELNSNIEQVWINEVGDWFTSEQSDCKIVTREEILKPSKKQKANE
jgi:hypothetical protein